MNCCTNILDLARITSCLGRLSLGVAATATGTYKLEVDFLDSVQVVEEDFAIGDNISFDLSSLNESYVFIGRIYDPTEQQVTKEINGRVYECFAFETIFVYGATGTVSLGGQQSITELHKSDFTDGVYLGNVGLTKAVFDTGIPNFLTKADQWDFVIENEIVVGLQLFIDLDDADIIYLFK